MAQTSQENFQLGCKSVHDGSLGMLGTRMQLPTPPEPHTHSLYPSPAQRTVSFCATAWGGVCEHKFRPSTGVPMC